MNPFSALLLDAPTADHFLFTGGKINTVAVVVFIIWGGALAYLLLTDRRVARLEKQAAELKDKVDAQKNKSGL